MKVRLITCLMCLATVDHARAQQAGYDAITAYKKESIQGFTVLINRQVTAQKEDAAEVRKELERQLKEIGCVVPTGPLAALRKVRIWVEWNRKENGGAEFHPSVKWLQDNGYNPEKAGSIEISNTRNFVKWSRAAQPCMVLHELAHAYDFLVLGEGDPSLKAAYRQAVDHKLYDEVDFVAGGRRKAYALVNHLEYFAELSEAYFGKNDFYPFTRSDLEKHDPVGYKALRKVWGEPRVAAPGRNHVSAAR
jgi:hypothetical protein